MKKRIRVRTRSQRGGIFAALQNILLAAAKSSKKRRLDAQGVPLPQKRRVRIKPRGNNFLSTALVENGDVGKNGKGLRIGNLDLSKLNFVRIGVLLGGVVVVIVACVLIFNRPSGPRINPNGPNMPGLPPNADAPGGMPPNAMPPAPPPTPSPSPTPVPTAHPLNEPFFEGVDSPVVAQIQMRLMELGYMDSDEPTEHFGPVTKGAVRLFQRQHALQADGAIGAETFNTLMGQNAQKYLVQEGVEGDDVHELQIRLREMGYLNAATSYYGTDTKAAVERFQERNGLSPDGMIGEQTREMLYSEDAKPNAYSYGDEGPEIKTFQERLKKLAYYNGDADGKNGKATVAAVKRFQERNGLIADGYVGPETKRLLSSSRAQANALLLGMKGSEVEKAQERLKKLKYLKSVTGYYGTDTQSAVVAFQKNNKLSADGKIGKATFASLMSEKAKPWTSSKAPPKAGSSGGSSGKGSGSGNAGPATNLSGVDAFISVAQSKMGSKYVRGGKGPNTFDCSGFVYWCLNQAGVRQGYMTSSGWAKTGKYPTIGKLSNAQKGDVLSFNGHVGIALGGGKMIDASSSQGKIRIANLSSPYWTKNYIAGYRIF